jgi:predicted metal-binding membrane protein
MLLTAAAAWMLLLTEPRAMPMIVPCAATGAGPMPSSLPMLLSMNPPGLLAAGWALMLIAMMTPVLIEPVRYIRMRSFTHRRARAVLLFLGGYAAVWMATGVVLLGSAFAVEAFAPQSYLPAAGIVLVALVWQFTPIKQRCLNRCHALSGLAAFGTAADLSALRFGAIHGLWCAVSCSAMMLAPMLLPGGQLVAMATVSILIFSERLEQPAVPRWRWHGFGQVIRILVAQTRIRLQSRQIDPALSE